MLGLSMVFVAGLVFAVGLGVAGMTLPQKVLAFLDFAGTWDPSLLFVMAGAVVVYAIGYRSVLRRPTPLFETAFQLPTSKDIDRPLVVGAILFGVGWGLVGFCPGPAMTDIVTGNPDVLIFFVSMIAGMYAYGTLNVAGSRDPDSGAAWLDRLFGSGKT